MAPLRWRASSLTLIACTLSLATASLLALVSDSQYGGDGANVALVTLNSTSGAQLSTPILLPDSIGALSSGCFAVGNGAVGAGIATCATVGFVNQCLALLSLTGKLEAHICVTNLVIDAVVWDGGPGAPPHGQWLVGAFNMSLADPTYSVYSLPAGMLVWPPHAPRISLGGDVHGGYAAFGPNDRTLLMLSGNTGPANLLSLSMDIGVPKTVSVTRVGLGLLVAKPGKEYFAWGEVGTTVSLQGIDPNTGAAVGGVLAKYSSVTSVGGVAWVDSSDLTRMRLASALSTVPAGAATEWVSVGFDGGGVIVRQTLSGAYPYVLGLGNVQGGQ